MPKRNANESAALPPVSIHELRGERVVLDADLAQIYGVPTKRLNEQVRRNAAKFPADFMFRLTAPEVIRLRSQIATASEDGAAMRSQIATSKPGRGGRRHRPYAFTEHGAVMAANLLNSPRAVEMSVFVIRAFVRMRSALTDTRALAGKLADIERELRGRLDVQETAIVDFIQRLLTLFETPAEPTEPKREIGFHSKG